MAPDGGKPVPLFRIRTVTAFVELPPDEALWAAELHMAGAFLAEARAAFEALGMEVQTLRVATQPFDAYLGPPGPGLPAAAARLEALAAGAGVALLSLGGVEDARYLPWIPPLLAATSALSCSFALPPSEPPCPALARRAAAAALQVAALTGGRRNFGFGVAVNCGGAAIPFFPVASADAASAGGFAVGTESDGILHAAWSAAASAAEAETEAGAVPLERAAAALSGALLEALSPVEAAALEVERRGSGTFAAATPGAAAAPAAAAAPLGPRCFRYLGIDTSIAPGLDTPPMTSAFEALRLGPFGAPGTLAACGVATRVLKSVPLRLTGYCGLMLAVAEDVGLAAAAAAGKLPIGSLLQWSAACGCGLDTVPVPGPGPDWPAVYAVAEPGAAEAVAAASALAAVAASPWAEGGSGAAAAVADAAAAAAAADPVAAAADNRATPAPANDEALLRAFTGILLDTAMLSARLAKPLATRLLPLPGRAAGDDTDFQNPYLLDTKVLLLG